MLEREKNNTSSEEKNLEENKRINNGELKSDGDGFAGKDYLNVDDLIGVLISNKLATLYELKTVYSVEDAMYMYEAYIVPKYNEYLQNTQAMKKVKKK